MKCCEYRIKPSPPKPREWWLVIGPGGNPQGCGIRDQPAIDPSVKRIHVREVFEQEAGK